MIKLENKIVKRVSVIVLTVTLILFLGMAGLGSWLYYLYRHPEKLKPRLERTISRLAGISLRIEDLNYSLNPIFVHFKGIKVHKDKELDLKIETLNIDMVRRISDKEKTLIIEKVSLNDFTGNFYGIPKLPEALFTQKEPPSLFSSIINKIRNRYLFQDLEFGMLKVSDGLINLETSRGRISIKKLTAEIDANNLSKMSCGLSAEYKKDMIFNAPQARISADLSLLEQTEKIPLVLSADGLKYHGPYADAEEISLQASLEYNRKQNTLALKSSHLSARRNLIYPGTSHEAIMPPCEVKALGNINLRDRHLENTHIHLTIAPLMTLEAVLSGDFGEDPSLNLDRIQAKISPEKLHPFVPPEIKNRLAPFHLQGDAVLTGEATFSGKKTTGPEGRLKVDLEKNRFTYQDQKTEIEAVLDGELYVNGRWPDLDVRADIKTTATGFTNPQMKISTETLELELTGKHPRYSIRNLSGKVRSLSILTDSAEHVFSDIRFESRDGEIDLADNRFYLSMQELSSPLVKNFPFTVILDQEKDKPLKFQDLTSWRIDFRGSLDEFNLNHINSYASTEGHLNGDIQFKGQWPAYQARAGFNSQNAQILTSRGSLSPRNLQLTLDIEHPHYRLRDLKVVIAQAAVILGEKKLPENDITVSLPNGYMNLEKKVFDIPKLSLITPLLGKADLSFGGGKNDFKVELKSKDAHLLKSASSWNLLPNDWKFNASETLELKAHFKENLHCTFTSNFELNNLNLSNHDATIIGEGLSLKSSLAGDLDSMDKRGNINLDLLVGKGELLWDVFYFNLHSNPVSLKSLLHVDIPHNLLNVSHLESILKDIVTLNLKGKICPLFDDPHFQFSLSVPETPLGPLFQTFIREPYQSKKTILKNLNVDGYFSTDLKIEGDEKINGLKGRITLRNTDLDLNDYDLRLKKMNLDLPLWYEKQTRQVQDKPNSDLKGRLAIESISAFWVPEQALSLALDVKQNQVSVKDPTEIIIPGGIARFGPIQGRDIYSHPLVETSLELKDIALGPWIDRIRPLNIRGSLSGVLNPVLFKNNQLKSEGELTARIFGGEIILSDLHISRLNTPTPIFGLDGSLHRLDLAEITANTSFGKIQGLLEGHIHNLEIAYGQPQRFNLLLETVRQRGVSQRISVEAVENIARLGGGQSPFMGLTGIYIAFLKDFPYEKIGLRSSLKNDVFRINGTIKENGKEYIIKRGLYGVNIINRDPDNRIRFKDMVKRIKNIDLSKTKPVIQ